jgi:hypothetical protein
MAAVFWLCVLFSLTYKEKECPFYAVTKKDVEELGA